MEHRFRRTVVATLAAALLLGWPAGAESPAGSGLIRGRSAFRVPACGRDRGRFAARVALQADGTWTAASPEIALAGTWAAAGTSGRRFALDLDAAASSAFFGSVAADVTEMCGLGATPAAMARKTFTLVLNRRRTRATVRLDYRFPSATSSRPATYRLVGSGRWTPG